VVSLNGVSRITDPQYNERTGSYVIEGIDGSFGPSGGRQILDIGITV